MLGPSAMPKAWSIFCDCPELAVDLARDAARIGLAVEPEVREDPASPAPCGWLAASEGSRLRSIFPFPVNGSCSRNTKWRGNM